MQIIHKYAKNKYFLKDSVWSPVIKCAKCCIVLKCDLWHFVLWVYGHLECVGAWKEFDKQVAQASEAKTCLHPSPWCQSTGSQCCSNRCLCIPQWCLGLHSSRNHSSVQRLHSHCPPDRRMPALKRCCLSLELLIICCLSSFWNCSYMSLTPYDPPQRAAPAGPWSQSGRRPPWNGNVDGRRASPRPVWESQVGSQQNPNWWWPWWTWEQKSIAQNCPLSPEQPSRVCLPVRVRGSLQVRLLGHAVLLHGTLQEEKGFVLQIRWGHQLVEIGFKVSLQRNVGTGSRLLSHLSVSANHSCQVVEALPWAEEVSKVVVVAIDQALLFPVAVKPAHHPCHVLPTKDRCWNCRTCISAEENITLCRKQVLCRLFSSCWMLVRLVLSHLCKGYQYSGQESIRPETELPASHHCLPNSPSITACHTPGTTIKPGAQ